MLNKLLVRITSYLLFSTFYLGFAAIFLTIGYVFINIYGGVPFNSGIFLIDWFNLGLKIYIFITIITWVWRFIKSFSRREKPIGIPIAETDLLHLQHLIDCTSRDLKTQKPDSIEILHLPNASATEVISRKKTIRKIYIGFPFLVLLTDIELKAIIAHELAHFDNDAFFLHRSFWNIETAILWWLQHSSDKSLDPDNLFGLARILIYGYVLIYFQLFNFVTKPFRYGFEYYCDKKAAQYYGADVTSVALQKAVAMQITFGDYLYQVKNNNLQFSFQQFFSHHQQLVEQPVFTDFLNEFSKKNNKTHPSLAKRLKNISRLPTRNMYSNNSLYISDNEFTTFEYRLMQLFKE